jgi:hypothetical protein
MSWRDRRRYRGKPSRPLNEADVAAWVDVAEERENKPPAQIDRDQWLAYLRAKNPVRVHRMKKDLQWAQRMLLKIGVDPEEVRWLL